MNAEDLTELAERYFAALDTRDMDLLSSLIAEDCVLRLENRNVVIRGADEIKTGFAERWTAPTWSLHYDFNHVVDAERQIIASHFRISSTGPHAPAPISNAAFFEVKDGRFSRISVFMGSETTIPL